MDDSGSSARYGGAAHEWRPLSPSRVHAGAVVRVSEVRRMLAPSLVIIVIALGLLAFVARSGYGVAPRVFFALAMAFAIVALTTPNGVAALAAGIFLVILGGITTIVDRRRIRSEG